MRFAANGQTHTNSVTPGRAKCIETDESKLLSAIQLLLLTYRLANRGSCAGEAFVHRSNPGIAAQNVAVNIKRCGNSAAVASCIEIIFLLCPCRFAYEGELHVRRHFLNDYIALVEGKRILLADPTTQNCPLPKG